MLQLHCICCCLLLSISLLFLQLNAAESIKPENNRNLSTNASAALKGKLIFAHVLYRHGDRMPVEPYPTDPWKDLSNWPAGWGQLTNTGKQEHFQLGQWLRKRYDSILNLTYSNSEFYIQSTDVDRTLMSALSNLAGLYPPVNKEIWNKNIAWQPIPVHTAPEKYDVLAGKRSCPAYDYALSILQNSIEFQKLNDRYGYLFDYLTQYTGRSVSSLEDIQRLNNTFYIENLYNKTLPEWTKKVYPSDDMTYISNFAFSISTYTRQMARLKIGPVIKAILDRFVAKAKGKLEPDRAVWVYSAHDTTVASVLNALKVFDIHSPPYTACILMELRIDEKQNPFVSIFYKNTTAEPLAINLPGCGYACPLNEMFKLYDDILPKDWQRECKLQILLMTYEDANVGTAMGILVAITIVLLFLSYFVKIYYRRRSYKTYSPFSQMT